MMRTEILAAAVAMGLCGCALEELPQRDTLARSTPGFTRSLPTDLRRETVFAATTRAPGDQGFDVFTGFRSPRPHFLRHEVTIPSSVDGTLDVSVSERASDPARHFVIASQTAIPDAVAFGREVAASLSGGQRIVLFVHGYNNSYRDGLYTMMHIRGREAAGFRPVMFSFASRSALSGYGYDKDSALAARPALAEVIERLAAVAPGRLDIAAHSMGTWLTVEALQQVALRRRGAAKPVLGGLLLASPDIDADLFDGIWPNIRGVAAQTLVVCHEADKALKASSLIGGGGERVGSLPDCAKAARERYPGLQAIDAAGFATSQQDRMLHNPGTNSALVDRIIAMSPK